MIKEHATLLIVDDEPQNLHLLGSILREEHEIIIATNGREAINRASGENPPTLILLDVTMPDMDGWEVCHELKANPATKNIPIIFVTGRDDVEAESKGLSIGAVDYITKPFSADIVKARVRTHLTLKWQADKLASLSCTDELTGLANRRHFNRRLNEEWQRAIRSGEPLSVVMIDVDHFKQYNDHYGHGLGDNCLQRVAQTLNTVVQRSLDLVARYGGEEFVAILPATNATHSKQLAERFCQAVNSLELEHALSLTSPHITISAGAATCLPDEQHDPDHLVETADRMLYKAKHAGRNQAITTVCECTSIK